MEKRGTNSTYFYTPILIAYYYDSCESVYRSIPSSFFHHRTVVIINITCDNEYIYK